MEKLSQQAVALYLSSYFIRHDTVPGGIAVELSKGTPQVDTILVRRDVVEQFRVYGWIDSMKTKYLRQPVPNERYVFHIPDSLSHRFIPAVDEDYELSFNTIIQFSPLLPSTDPEVYLMQCYKWQNACGSGRCVKVLNRCFLRYRVNKRGITLLPDIVPTTGPDEYSDAGFGLGGYNYSQFVNAKPGDKIKWE